MSDGASASGSADDPTLVAASLHGWLKKKGDDMIGAYQQRYFTVRGAHLNYFKDDSAGALPTGSVDLRTVLSVSPSGKDSVTFTVTVPGRHYVLQAASDVERARWCDGLCSLAAVHSPQFSADVPLPRTSSLGARTASKDKRQSAHLLVKWGSKGKTLFKSDAEESTPSSSSSWSSPATATPTIVTTDAPSPAAAAAAASAAASSSSSSSSYQPPAQQPSLPRANSTSTVTRGASALGPRQASASRAAWGNSAAAAAAGDDLDDALDDYGSPAVPRAHVHSHQRSPSIAAAQHDYYGSPQVARAAKTHQRSPSVAAGLSATPSPEQMARIPTQPAELMRFIDEQAFAAQEIESELHALREERDRERRQNDNFKEQLRMQEEILSDLRWKQGAQKLGTQGGGQDPVFHL